MPRLAVHLIWGCYGFWLPNDPRGSWSTYVGSRPLYEAGGAATKVMTTRSLAGRTHDRDLRQRAKHSLADPPVRLTGVQARDVAQGIGVASDAAGFAIFALAMMPDHVHVVLANASENARVTIGRLKGGATRRLNECGHSPRGGATPWVRAGWFVSLEEVDAVRRAIAYVNQNPVRAGLRAQHWSFVKPFEGG